MTERIEVEFLGFRLPSSNPVLNFRRLTKRLSKLEVKQMEEIDDVILPLVRIPGARSSFTLGKADGLSQGYRWSWENGYRQMMTPSDWRILSTRMAERRAFRNLNDPRDAKREAEYPPPDYIATLQATRFGKQKRLGRKEALFMRKLKRVGRGDVHLPFLGSRTMKWGPPEEGTA